MLRGFLLCALIALQQPSVPTHEIPAQLQGDWVVTRLIPTRTISCWGQREANRFLRTTIHYSVDSFAWKTYVVREPAVDTKTYTAQEFHDDYSGGGAADSQIDFVQLGIRQPTAAVVSIHHAAADITGGTIEIPGDWALLKNPDTIIISVCNLYFEAHRASPGAHAHQ